MSTGNLSHIHALLWVNETSKMISEMLSCIRGSVIDLIHHDKIELFIEEGILRDEHDVITVQELAGKFLWHVGNRCCKCKVVKVKQSKVVKPYEDY